MAYLNIIIIVNFLVYGLIYQTDIQGAIWAFTRDLTKISYILTLQPLQLSKMLFNNHWKYFKVSEDIVSHLNDWTTSGQVLVLNSLCPCIPCPLPHSLWFLPNGTKLWDIYIYAFEFTIVQKLYLFICYVYTVGNL